MKHKHYNTLMEHPLGTKALRALLYSVGLPRTAEEEQIFADTAQAYEKMAPQTQAQHLWTLFQLDELYLGTDAFIVVAKVMSELYYERAYLTLELAKSAHGLAQPEDRSKAFRKAEEDARKCRQHFRELLLLTLRVAAKRIEATLMECAGQK